MSRQRNIQRAVDTGAKPRKSKAMKAQGDKQPRARHPKAPVPEQHLRKPGREADLQPAPQFQAPTYKGSGKLKGMVALITGGDSGIGRAVAVLFAREGADVGIVYLSEHDDARTTCHAVEQEGQNCVRVAGDVGDPAFCKRAVKKVVKELGQLDILVNNAAFQEHASGLEELSDAHFEQTMRTNVYGYFNMAKAAMKQLGSGSCIINTGSETGFFGSAGLIDYSMTKGAIHAFTKALASKLIEQGIRVNAVAPGPVWTPLNPADRPAEEIPSFGQDNPMGRPAQPEEIAPAYVFLAAPSCASYINGAILPVMGGPKG